MIYANLPDGTEVLADDLTSQLLGPFVCPYCKTQLIFKAPRSSYISKHFAHRKEAPEDCPGRNGEPRRDGPIIHAHIHVYTHGRISRNPGGIMTHSVVILNELDEEIYSKTDFVGNKYTDHLHKATNIVAHQIALNEGLEIATVTPHTSVSIYTSCMITLRRINFNNIEPGFVENSFGWMVRKPTELSNADGEFIRQVSLSAHSFLNSPEIKHCKKNDNPAAKNHSDIAKQMINKISNEQLKIPF